MRKQPLLYGVVMQVEMGLGVARMKENRNAQDFDGEPEGKKSL